MSSKPKKPFSWSYSKLKNFNTCAFRHQQIDLLKAFVEVVEPGGPLDWGNQVHKALAASVSTGAALPTEMAMYGAWPDRITKLPDGRPRGGTLLVEQKLAITKDFAKCSWFTDIAWYRGIGDVIRINGPVALAVDWKTGKMVHDSAQLFLLAQCIFAHYPKVNTVKSTFVWLKDYTPGMEMEECMSSDTYERANMANDWVGILDQVAMMQEAYETESYPAMPGRLCRSWCPVRSCQYHGK